MVALRRVLGHTEFFFAAWLQTPAACIATIAEISFGLALVGGFLLREAAYGIAVLLGVFALAMTISLGIKAPLNYSVFVDAGAAWLLVDTSRLAG